MGFLDGKVAVITGGNRGIGRGIADALAPEGATVVLTARSASAAHEAAKEVGHGAIGVACDVRAYESVQRLFRECDARAGGCDILINNAGIGLFGPVADTEPEDWRAVIETNLNGAFYCCHEAIPQMRKRGGGYIFNISCCCRSRSRWSWRSWSLRWRICATARRKSSSASERAAARRMSALICIWCS